MPDENPDISGALNDGMNGAEKPPQKARGFQVSHDPVGHEEGATAGESEGEGHKFFVGAEPVATTAATPAFEDLGELPASYFEDTLFLVARDPRWLFSYWDFNWAQYPAAAMRGGVAQFS